MTLVSPMASCLFFVYFAFYLKTDSCCEVSASVLTSLMDYSCLFLYVSPAAPRTTDALEVGRLSISVCAGWRLHAGSVIRLSVWLWCMVGVGLTETAEGKVSTLIIDSV